MVRKRRTELPSGSESSESGSQRPTAPPPQQQQQGGGGYQGGRGSPPQQQGGGGYQQPQGGRGSTPQGGRGGYGGGRGGHGMPQQQQYGGPPEYQGRGRGGPPQQGGRGGYGGGRGGPSPGGPSRPQVSELHQATPVPYQAGVTPQPVTPQPAYQASSSSQPPEPSEVAEQFQQVSIRQEEAPSQAIQQVPVSSKSMRFPLRPGKGKTGIRCTVKANHFFAELPDKDLHQYDVSSLALCVCIFIRTLYDDNMKDNNFVLLCVRSLLHRKSRHGV